MPAPTDPLNRKPWPMKWVVLAIVACIVPYTWLTLAYRKESPAYQPYQDSKDRAQVMRLLGAGYQRIDLHFEPPAEPASATTDLATTEPVPGGIPFTLSEVLIDPPPLPSTIDRVQAPSQVPAGADYTLRFDYRPPDLTERPTNTAPAAVAYRRDDEITLLIDVAPPPADRDGAVRRTTTGITLPTHHLDPGTYRATLLGARSSLRWQFEVL